MIAAIVGSSPRKEIGKPKGDRNMDIAKVFRKVKREVDVNWSRWREVLKVCSGI